MLHIALYQPEIPPNTGNIIRLCANLGAQLHLIHPLGFALEDKQLRRAGLDYREWVNVQEYADYSEFISNFSESRIFACSTKGKSIYTNVSFRQNDILLFGPETRGLPKEILEMLPGESIIRIPMLPNSRSLNLSNSVAVILYEAYRQLGFMGLS
ncbi:MAG: tRNA (uridine(34)/cytosine(34)/5-carboxymethylaminomethyluridine(34)-2'-O)-methyltransferase TrmL [Proteobacteria bacterium]|nr:tRNA (uridine(34)/cytosine(34)/5-carboxymethylaminomethyluridine(34)-2'-O)-methyltransferase TrmL [Pseudomonadota bacterium]